MLELLAFMWLICTAFCGVAAVLIWATQNPWEYDGDPLQPP